MTQRIRRIEFIIDTSTYARIRRVRAFQRGTSPCQRAPVVLLRARPRAPVRAVDEPARDAARCSARGATSRWGI